VFQRWTKVLQPWDDMRVSHYNDIFIFGRTDRLINSFVIFYCKLCGDHVPTEIVQGFSDVTQMHFWKWFSVENLAWVEVVCQSVALRHVPAMFVSFILKHTPDLLTPNPGRARVKEGMSSWAGEPIRRRINDCTTKACFGTLQSTSLTDLHLVSPAHTQARLPEARLHCCTKPSSIKQL